MKNEEERKRNKGVSCSVAECAYHCGENACAARTVSVGPVNARCCAETVCATFRSKSE
ncbi:MAG: DUF1540 domain-containing protein [Clostridia bacterium]|nr:DUF1540 domain-containing protein [Clostridia bacterium]